MNAERPRLIGLAIADPPSRWQALGFTVDQDRLELGGVRIALGGDQQGITAWTLAGVPAVAAIDGLPTAVAESGPEEAVGPPHDDGPPHANGATGLDHMVVVTPDFQRTAAAFDGVGLTLRRIRDAGGVRQGFRRLGPAILELVEAPQLPAGPARFWGLVVVVADLDTLRVQLGPDLLGAPKPAVQAGRSIATLRPTSGVSPAVAFITPETDT